ncbi:hypothetical protein GCM10011529_05410 [Polymorphobacter glacialis]|uniref:TraB/GumN family protein n=1 Tax=Sandarakinorhabdus glacialis TaxID=1614636 RepID=A0A916ZK96_9SPHN|nr:TraB/GumN family protein [Polymorphobacter glacialis]GGE01936.1 hypothetical protein GCM10011529_05410 [Polymorphobacter glacialis]
MRLSFWILALLVAAPALLVLPAAPAGAAPGVWVVRDADTEITLFGTIHALPKGEKWLSPGLAARFDAADTLVLEAIIPDDAYSLAPMVAEIGMAAPGAPALKPLAARVTPAAALLIPSASQAAGVPVAALDRMETWLAAITLGEATLRAAGFDSGNGVEPALTLRAKAAKKAIVALETPEQQLRFFDGLPEADQAAMLEATLTDLRMAKEDSARLLALWRAGDVGAIERDFAREVRASPLLAKVLLTDRNRRWADWISGVMRRPGKVFVAVGAGHFGGTAGLLALLQARGMVVEKVQ